MSQRPYPSSIESERALLGGLILDPGRLFEASQLVRTEDFHQEVHARLFQLMLDLQKTGTQIDMVSISDAVQSEDRANTFGGLEYVIRLTEHVPATANLTHYAALIREKALLRKLIETTESVTQKAYSQPADVATLVGEAAREIQELAVQGDKRDWTQISMVIDDQMEAIAELGKGESDIPGIPTGFIDLDEKLSGLHPTNLVILAARPAMGKTALALNLAQHAAMRTGRAVGIFSLEMGRGELVSRMLCNRGEVDATRLKRGNLSPEEWNRLEDAADELRRLHVHIDDTGHLTLADVRARALALANRESDLGMVVIDYLQLMKGDPRIQSREQQISDISRGLKALAKDLQIPVVALSQLNRGVESRQNKRPLVSDLRESGAIEQDADVILFIYRDEYYHPEETQDPGVAEVIIAKHRAGPTGTVKLLFQGEFARFANYAPESHIALD